VIVFFGFHPLFNIKVKDENEDEARLKFFLVNGIAMLIVVMAFFRYVF
jgi:hypothetical protein